MESDPFPQQPLRRKRRSTSELLEAARKTEARAIERAARKGRHVQKYEAVQKARERKRDTRRKIIAGALALEHMRHDGRYAQALRALIDEYVTRDQDRELFGLEPLPGEDQRRVNPPKVY